MTTNTRAHVLMAWTLAITCWLAGTGLAIEKVLKDGVTSWTLLLSMPVITAAVAFLLHIAVDDLRSWSWRILRAPIAVALAVLGLAVTLPTSIGSSGAAVDHVVAEATKSAEDVARIGRDYQKTVALVDEATKWQAKDCRKDRTSDACRGATFVLNQRKASAESLQRQLEGHKAGPEPLADEKRIAWALAFVPSLKNIKPGDVAMAKPLVPPFVFELFAAFFGCMALGRAGANRVPVSGNPPRGGKLDETVPAISPPAETPLMAALKEETPEERDTRLVLEALAQAGRPVSNDELAGLMLVEKSEATKRRKVAEQAGAVISERDGAFLVIRRATAAMH